MALAASHQGLEGHRDDVGGVELTIWLVDYDGVVDNHAPDEHDELRWVDSGELSTLPLADPSYVALLDPAFAG